MKASLVVLDYQGLTVSFNEDGWFNATIAARHFQMEPFDWLRLHETEEYMRALSGFLELPFEPVFVSRKSSGKVTGGKSGFRPELNKNNALVKTKRGAPETGGGTWLHPKLAVPFARWWARFLLASRTKQRLARLVLRRRDQVRRRRLGWR